MKKILLLIIGIVFFACLTSSAQGTLRDKNGQLLRGTPMVIGKSLAASVAFAENISNWTKIRDTYKMNTVRLCWVDPWYKDEGYANWTVAEAMPHIEKCVANASSAGMNIIINYHNTGEQVRKGKDLSKNQALREDFWRNIAIKFKDNDRVFFELSNEPVFYHTDYNDNTFKTNLMNVYYIVRYEAPNRQILLFSFNSTAYDLMSVINTYKSGIDWSKTSVAFHAYSGDGTSAKITQIMQTYRTICTEWDYPGTQTYVKTIDGFAVNSQSLENINCSWSDWRGWGDNTTDEIETKLIADAKAKGYWWFNAALNKTASQSSTYTTGTANKAVDGNLNGVFSAGSVTHTNNTAQAWWQVDLGAIYNITKIKVYNRTDCCADRLSNFYTFVSDNAFSSTSLSTTIGQAGVSNYYTTGQGGSPTIKAVNRSGRYVRIQLSGTNFLNLAEVEVLSSGLKSAVSRVETSQGVDITVYPNPANDFITIQGLGDKPYQVLVFDYQGKEIKNIYFESNSSKVIPVNDLPVGMYMLHIKGENLVGSKKFIRAL